MNNAVFGKTMEKVKKHRDIKLIINVTRRKYLVSEPNIIQQNFVPEIYQSQKWKQHIFIYKSVYLGLSIL